jgi:hypothetical protein
LAIDNTAIVEFGDTGDLDSLGGGVEINDLLCLALESCATCEQRKERPNRVATAAASTAMDLATYSG